MLDWISAHLLSSFLLGLMAGGTALLIEVFAVVTDVGGVVVYFVRNDGYRPDTKFPRGGKVTVLLLLMTFLLWGTVAYDVVSQYVRAP